LSIIVATDVSGNPWSLLAVATIHGDASGHRAMENLCQLYYNR